MDKSFVIHIYVLTNKICKIVILITREIGIEMHNNSFISESINLTFAR